ncbi:MAG: hypothetical protein PWP67_3001 [Clostridium butyricum]|jgi:hypothetical protein|uniref:hypothetical protein n=1 Tax=Thermoanaerobacterium thermosaccharolyticum TaxID=1517 RepID=UPI0027AA37EF|nr:hypothetical protein [Thermoanaerobacterium sp.]MDK2830167.1 hypothetical protein [Clostridium butyricum]WHE06557.1 hypothetical protein PGH24_10420 [Thermoanaerobacterium thermosaccharolyticum]
MKRIFVSLLILTLFLNGCGISHVKNNNIDSNKPYKIISKSTDTASHLNKMPPTKQELIREEGIEYKVSYKLFDCSKLSPGFLTYIPESMKTQLSNSSDGSTVIRIYETSKEGQTLHDYNYIQIFYYPKNTEKNAAIELIKNLSNKYNLNENQNIRKWAILQYNGIYGTIALGYYNKRYFYVLTHSTTESADIFNPLSERIFAEWRWTDTGKGLID